MNLKERARLGLFHLEETVLSLLEDHYPECLQPKAIGDALGIYRERGVVGMNDAIVTGVLNLLHRKNEVEQCKPEPGRKRGGGWRITEATYTRRNP